MRALKAFVLLYLCLVLAYVQTNAGAQEVLSDPRQCNFVARNADGSIKRSGAELRKFQILHPCPSTGQVTGTCPGWSIDHVISLACGGCDSFINMQWLPNRAKSCSENYCKDRWERKVQYVDQTMPGISLRSCVPVVLTELYFEPLPIPSTPE